MTMSNDLSTARTLVGVFADAHSAAQAINDLKVAGFVPEAISVISKDRRIAAETDLDGDDNRAAEGTLAGSLGGGTLGAVLGWLLAGGVALIPGVGPVIAAGVFAATLTGALVGGALGGISGALAGVGVPEEDAREYQSHFSEGRTVLAVTAANGYQMESAGDVFERNGATLTRQYAGTQRDVATREALSETEAATTDSTSTQNSMPFATSTYREAGTIDDISTLPANSGTGTVPRPRTDLDDATLPGSAIPTDRRDDLPPPAVVI